jgi:phytoene dehydrogenase-like protein
MGEIDGAFRSWGLSRGGTGAISEAIAAAAREAGAEIRTETAVSKIIVKDDAAVGVVLANGDYLTANVIASSVDPRVTFMKMVGAEHLPVEFVADIQRYKFRGSSGKVNLALDALPDFKAMPGDGPHLRGAISISPSVDYMERAYDSAKYGQYSKRPYIDIVIPSLTDPSVAPAGKHVMSCFVQYAPYHLKEGTWDEQREAFGDTVIDTIAEYAPNIRNIILHRQVLTPLDIEREFGLTEGNIFQGELTLEQLFFLRPAPGWASTHAVEISTCADHRPTPAAESWARPDGTPRGKSSRIWERASEPRHHRRGGAQRSDGRVLPREGGLKPLVLERRPVVGGTATTEEIAPGFRAPSLAHAIGPLRLSVVRDMRLESRGVEFIRPNPRLAALTADGPALVFSVDHYRTAEAIRRHSARDAEKYIEFCETLARVSNFLAPLLTATPPSIDGPDRGDVWELVRAGFRFRGLGKKDGYRLIRWGPMSAADLVSEWFETDLVQAPIAARGIFGAAQGPRSAGTAALLLLNAAADPAPGGSSITVKGGPGALTAAMADAAREAGAEIRLSSGVRRVLVRDGRVAAVVLDDGTEVSATAVISNADPRRTLLDLVDPVDLDRGSRRDSELSLARNDGSKIALAPCRCSPGFRTLEMCTPARGPRRETPHARSMHQYGGSPRAVCHMKFRPSVIRHWRTRKHVVSVCVQFTPRQLSGGRSWTAARRNSVERDADAGPFAPGIESWWNTPGVLAPMVSGTTG